MLVGIALCQDVEGKVDRAEYPRCNTVKEVQVLRPNVFGA